MPISGSSDSASNKRFIKNIGKWGYNYLINVEEIVGKEKKMLVMSNFFFSPQCFQILSVVDASKWISME